MVCSPSPYPSPTRDCVAIGKMSCFVILNEVKNLMISNESIIEILRLSPQNDIPTQPPRAEGGKKGDGNRYQTPRCHPMLLHRCAEVVGHVRSGRPRPRGRITHGEAHRAGPHGRSID